MSVSEPCRLNSIPVYSMCQRNSKPPHTCAPAGAGRRCVHLSLRPSGSSQITRRAHLSVPQSATGRGPAKRTTGSIAARYNGRPDGRRSRSQSAGQPRNGGAKDIMSISIRTTGGGASGAGSSRFWADSRAYCWPALGNLTIPRRAAAFGLRLDRTKRPEMGHNAAPKSLLRV